MAKQTTAAYKRTHGYKVGQVVFVDEGPLTGKPVRANAVERKILELAPGCDQVKVGSGGEVKWISIHRIAGSPA